MILLNNVEVNKRISYKDLKEGDIIYIIDNDLTLEVIWAYHERRCADCYFHSKNPLDYCCFNKIIDNISLYEDGAHILCAGIDADPYFNFREVKNHC